MNTKRPVEIKVSLAGDVDSLVNQLHLDGGEALQIWFLDDLTEGLHTQLPLSAAGIILRLRARGDQDDSTVKLRPARASQLMGRWGKDDKQGKWQHRVEADWAGATHFLAVSSVLRLPAGDAARAAARGGDPAKAFGSEQLDFLAQCADVPVNPSGLRALGPIAATKWEDVDLPGVSDLNAERWTVSGLDFLELSIRVDPDDGIDPVAAQASFEAAVRAAGFVIPAVQVAKTGQVLELLAKAARAAGDLG